MKKRVLLSFIVLMTIVFPALAQKRQINGRLTDSTSSEGLPNAAVALMQLPDSSITTSTVSDAKGVFSITSAPVGNYLLVVSYMGYRQFTRKISLKDTTGVVDLGAIAMRRKGLDLDEVEIINVVPPIVIKEDTVEFNAGSFKTRENALVEDLLKKLPGVQVDKDGKITANGQEVKKVLVDGKPFFGNDPKMATRNLPAEIMDKIQLIDQKSDQAQFTGIDDGEREKAINLVIKSDRRKGVFGRGTAGYGTDDRFTLNANINSFRQTKQFSLIAGGNNLGSTGFTFNDGFGFGGGGGGRGGGRGGGGGGGGGGGMGGNGLMRAWNGGINFSDEFSKKLRFSGSYQYSNVDRETERTSQRTNKPKPDSTSYLDRNNSSLSGNESHNLNMRVEYDIDSFHSVVFTPTLTYSTGDNYSQTRNTTYTSEQDTVNNGRTFNRSTGTNPNLNGNLLFRKKFDKKGRTFSTNISFGFNSDEREAINQSQTMYRDRSGSSYIDSIDQKVLQDNSSRNLGVRLSYTEPLPNDRFLELNYGYQNNFSKTDRKTYDKNKFGNVYDQLDDSLTNAFDNTYSNHQVGLNVKTQRLRYNYTVGLGMQFNNLNSNNITKDSAIHQSTVNFAPVASFNYNFSRERRLRFSYRGQTQQPSLEQLQPVPDNSNPLYIRLGNPDLKPSFSNNLSINYNNFNPVTYRTFFVNGGGSFVINQIENATTLSKDGKQYTQPVNVNGSYNLNADVVNGFSLSHTQEIQASLNFSTAASFRHDVSYLNSLKNFTNTITASQGVNLMYAYKDLFDISASGRVNYNTARFSTDNTSNYNYLDYNASLDFNVNLPLGFSIGADGDFTANTGRAEGYNLSYTMINAFAQKSMFKKKQGLIKVQVFDLLKQNVSISRTIDQYYIEDSQSLVQQQYFMVSFTYFLNRFGGRGQRGNRDGNRMNPFQNGGGMRGGGMRGGGGRGGRSF